MIAIKRLLAVISIIMLVFALPNAVYASISNEVSVTIDGRKVEFVDQKPIIVDGRTLVPIRGVFEVLRFIVDWNQDEQRAVLSANDIVVITIGSEIFTTNDLSYSLDVSAQIINGRTMLPIRAVLESVGYYVDWDSSTNTVIVRSKHIAADNQIAFSQRLTIGGFYGPSFAITKDSVLWTWGRGYFDIPISGSTATAWGGFSYEPEEVAGNVVAVSAGPGHAMMIKNDKTLWGFGLNESGQLGDGTRTDRSEPVWIMDDVVVVIIDGGTTFAIKNDKTLWGFGLNESGQLGDGTRTDHSEPVWIMDDVVVVNAGGGTAFAIKSDGSLWMWGHDAITSLKDMDVTWGVIPDYSLEPTCVMEDVISVSATGSHFAVIKSDSSLWLWGYNLFGAIGDGTRENRFEPVHVMNDVAAVATGNHHTMAIKTDGSLWAWGIYWNEDSLFEPRDYFSTFDENIPRIPRWIMDDVVSISVGGIGNAIGYTMALTRDGRLWSWGLGGRLTDGREFTDRHSPILIMENVKLPS